MERTSAADVQTGPVLVSGWVSQMRDLGNLKFFLLRDRTGQIQITAKKGVTKPGVLAAVAGLNREDCVTVIGKAVASTQAPGGREIVPDEIVAVAKSAVPLPIETSGKIQSAVDKRFDYRFIDLRNPLVMAIFRVKAAALAGIRDFFSQNGFVETHTPIIQAAGAEGGSNLFPIIYYQKEAFLRQSPQLYKQMLMASGMDRVYEIGPAFRAEKFHTRRHVSEFVSVDGEIGWIQSVEDVYQMLERMAVHTIKAVQKSCPEELKLFERKVTVPELPFPRLTYQQVLDTLNKEKGTKLAFGDDISDPDERVFGELMEKKGHEWYFITGYPAEVKPFYIMMDGEISRGFDLEFRGLELASGGQREHRIDVLTKMMRSKGLEPDDFRFYMDAFRYGCPPHGGFGFGVERMVQQLLGLENVKEAILFPRTPEKLVP